MTGAPEHIKCAPIKNDKFKYSCKTILLSKFVLWFSPLTQSFDARMLKEQPTTVRLLLSLTRKSKILILKIVKKAENVGFQLKCNLIGRNVI